jgi:AcrR family transcriptional regulator
MREKIVRTAEARFRHYGFGKTTVGDIAEDLGVSNAYVYKFFDSKLAINEAVALDILGRIGAELWKVARSKKSAADRLRQLYRTLLAESTAMFFNDRKLHDMVESAVENDWCAVSRHRETIAAVARQIIADGRAAGEFSVELDEARTVRAVSSTLSIFAHPIMLRTMMGSDVKAQADDMADFVLRGLGA